MKISSPRRFGLTTTALLALGTAFALPHMAVAQNAPSIADIKKELLSDKAFIKALVESPAFKEAFLANKERVEDVVKAYLVTHPEIMLEVEESLTKYQESQQSANHERIIKAMAKEIFHSPDDAVFGNPDGDIAIVEFFDYNCGYCKHSLPDMLSLIKANPRIKFIMKDFPILGPDSVKTHIVARAFQKLLPEKYLEFHRELLSVKGRATEEKAIQIAVSKGANEEKLRNLMQDESMQTPLMQTGQIAYQLGINGTPSYIIGNEVMVGAVGEKTLRSAIAKLESEKKANE